VAATATERKLLIGGEWVETGDWVEVRSPYSGEVVGRVAKAGAKEAKAAIDAAERAMADPLPAHKRAEILVKTVAGIARRHDEIAAQISAEAGKPLKAAKVETSRAMSTYTFRPSRRASSPARSSPWTQPRQARASSHLTLREPIGIVGAISPFNFPLNLVAHKIAPALAGRLRGRAQARGSDSAFRADARRA
jgi:acyl-CoA reductase-like NAD-dependent aldehyde dehydrogenase